jgi:hypothetical protein
MSRTDARLRHLGERADPANDGTAEIYRKETEMRKLIANEFMTLDGVVQAPSYADEDTTGGFQHGGWHSRYFDDLSMSWVVENVSRAGGYLLGRGTDEMFAAHWPKRARGATDARRAPEHAAEVRRLDHACRATRVAELDAAARRHREGCNRPEGGGWKRPSRDRQPRTRAEPDRARPGRRAPADDRPAYRGRRQAPLRAPPAASSCG